MIRDGLRGTAVLLSLAILTSLYGWITLPDGEMVATHWNAQGVADGWSSKTVAMLVMPVVMAGTAALLAVVPRIDPRRANLEASRKFYLSAWLGTLGVLLVAHVFIVHSALVGGAATVAPIIVAVALLFGLIGNYMAKSRSNWFAGLRTPWSLSSDAAWSASNRICGYGFVVTAVAVIASLVVDISWAPPVLLGGAFASIMAGTWVSYAVWRREQT